MLEYESRLSSIPNAGRREFAGTTIFLDYALKSAVSTLAEYGMWENTMLIYVSDNGADPTTEGLGSNWPLRGRKTTLFEGGIKVPAFIHSPFLSSASRGIMYSNMMHVTDWLPTLIGGMLGRRDILRSSGIIGTARQRQGFDGIDQWDQLLHGGGSYSADSPRNEILVNMNYLGSNHTWLGYDIAAIIVGPWKLILNEYNETSWALPLDDNVDNYKSGEGTTVQSFLFDLSEDPSEVSNLYDRYPDKVLQSQTTILRSHAYLIRLYCYLMLRLLNSLLS